MTSHHHPKNGDHNQGLHPSPWLYYILIFEYRYVIWGDTYWNIRFLFRTICFYLIILFCVINYFIITTCFDLCMPYSGYSNHQVNFVLWHSYYTWVFHTLVLYVFAVCCRWLSWYLSSLFLLFGSPCWDFVINLLASEFYI